MLRLEMFEVDCRLAKSHDVFVPISSSHELATDFSRFLEKSNPRIKFGAVGFVSKLDMDR